jgi:hypothetical protein
MTDREHLIRALWTLYEPIHAVAYFSPEVRDAFAAIGLPRYWDSYFAGRAAPLGAIGAAPVTAIFSGFAPSIIERALPSVWSTVTPDAALEARSLGAADSLRGFLPDAGVVAQAADALTDIAARVGTVGRPLAAANHELAVERDPYRRLWQATATLREHRGDGHVIALVAGDIAGLSTIVLRCSLDLDATAMQRSRGWSDDEWQTARQDLTVRGLIGDDLRITAAGSAALATAEHLTNALAVGPWAHLDDAALREIAILLHPLAIAVGELFPYPNPIGMPEPWDPESDPEALQIGRTPGA